MKEYHFEYSNDIQPGRVVFKLDNSGREIHSMTLLPLTEDFPPIDEQLRGSVRRGLTSVVDVQVPVGQGATVAADLAPGRYAMVCFVQSPDAIPHSIKGMSSEFRIR